ncbi:MAG: lytic transglycosylase domain-containing protein [Longimicrobiales bacterium]
MEPNSHERRRVTEGESPHRRRKQDFFRKYRQPLIGLGLVGTALPLANAQHKADQANGQPVEPAAQASASEEAAAASRNDTEESIVARIADSRGTNDRAVHIKSAIAEFGIGEDLAADIYDIAKQEGIAPKLAYGLVRTESTFKERAVSGVGARGLTQVMPRTAKWLLPGTKAQDLFDRKTNLKLGFRYLNQLTDRYRGNTKLALLAYNRGPGTVDKVLRKGGNPDNGYARKVMGL